MFNHNISLETLKETTTFMQSMYKMIKIKERMYKSLCSNVENMVQITSRAPLIHSDPLDLGVRIYINVQIFHEVIDRSTMPICGHVIYLLFRRV